jgi:hypothetical protein
MFTVSVEKECGCFKKSGMDNHINISSKDDALSEAVDMSDNMNEDFCGKHSFYVREQGNNFIISMKNQESHGGGCCGGGCH